MYSPSRPRMVASRAASVAAEQTFVEVLRKAMSEQLGTDAEEVEKGLSRNGINRSLAKQALELACEQGRFTIWSLVDALTRLSAKLPNAGDRAEADQKAAGLLTLAAPRGRRSDAPVLD